METNTPRRTARQLKLTDKMKAFNGIHKVRNEKIIEKENNDSDENTESDEHSEIVISNKRQRMMTDNENENKVEENEFSEYELLQKKNIEERNQFLQSLGIKNSLKDLVQVCSQTNKSKAKITPQRRTSSTYELPKREPSRRIQALAAAKIGTNDNLDSEKYKFKTEYELPKKESCKETIDDRLTGTVSLKLEEESLDILHCFQFLDENCKYDPNVDLSSCDVDSFRRNLACLQMIGPHKVTAKRIQSLCIHPAISKQIALAGCADGSLGLWDINADLENDVVEFSYHRAPLNCVSVSNFNHCKIYTTSHDGTVCCVDIEHRQSSNIFSTDFNSHIKHLTWHEEINANTLLISHGDGSVGVLDIRGNNKVSWINCFDRSCRTVQLNPVNSDYFLASSGTRGCKIFDLRCSPKSICIADMTHPKGLTSAFFSPNGNQILTTCNDDHLRIFDSSAFVESVPKQKKTIVHNNHTGRWLSVFKAAWFPNRNDVFHVGSLLSPRRIQFFENSGSPIFDLIHDEMLTISPVIAVHPKLPIIAGGNSSGRIHAFVPPKNDFAALSEHEL